VDLDLHSHLIEAFNTPAGRKLAVIGERPNIGIDAVGALGTLITMVGFIT
jgi:hypothetical protein